MRTGYVVELPYPTDDVRLLTKAAVGALDRIFRPASTTARPR